MHQNNSIQAQATMIRKDRIAKAKATRLQFLTDPQARHASQLCPFLGCESSDEDQHLLHLLLEHDLQVFIATHQLHKHLHRRRDGQRQRRG